MKLTLLFSLFLLGFLGAQRFQLKAAYRREAALTQKVQALQTELTKRLRTSAPKKLGTIRFTPGSPTLAVKASVNDGPAGRFLIDTGATYVTLSKSFADSLRIPYRLGIEKSFATQHGKVSGWVLIVDSIEVHGIKAKKVAVAVLEEGSSLVGVDGLLGLSFLARFKYQIDSLRGEIVLQPARKVTHPN